MLKRWGLLLIAPIILAGCEDVTDPAAGPATFHITPGRPFTVNTRNDIDHGFCSYRHCSLREAINAANAKPGPDRIVFRIPGSGVRTIQPLSQLPTITDSVVIDGYTQRGSSPNTNPPELGTNAVVTIELDGTKAGSPWISGLFINASGTMVRGLAINRFSGNGIFIHGSVATANLLQGNFIGTDAAGTADLGNVFNGVLISGFATDNLVGGSAPEARNLISGNDFAGVNIFSSNNTVQGNFIGTNASGDGILTNTVVGITIQTDAEGNLVGGTDPGAGNVISGNGNGNEGGLTLITGARMNEALGNYIGTDATGVLDLGNNGPGVYIVSNASDNTISGNTVAFNRRDGFRVLSGVRNTIRANSIFSNTGLGIDLNDDGVTPNDPGDADTGPNDLLNFPRLMAAEGTAERLRVLGDIDTPNPQGVIVELFANLVPGPGGDPTGHGEGALFLGTAIPDSRGVFLAKLSPVPVGTLISATATNAQGSTSEFSANIVVKAPRI